MKSKSLLAVSVMATLLSVQAAQAEFFLCEGGEKKSVEDTSAEAKNKKMKWNQKLMEQLKGTALEYSLNLPTAHLADVNFDFGVNRSSEKTISGKYSQADVWRLGLSSNILDSDPGATLGLFGNITYVRQFDTRKESICKDVPFYNPVDKIPKSAADFDLKREDSLKVGQLIEFETELTLGVPEWLTSIAKLKVLSPFAMNGRFKVQIFRMSPNLVRVRVKTIQETSGRIGFKYRILNLPGVLGKKTEVEVKFHEVTLTEMEVVDTVFNLDPKLNAVMAKRGKKTAAELYDSLIGTKLQLEYKNTLKLIVDAVKMNIPYDKYRDKVMSELNALLDASKEDALRRDGTSVFGDKGRRVYLISKAKANGVSRGSSARANLLNLAQIKLQTYDHESFMSITESTHQTNNFLLHGLGKFSQWKVLKLFGKTFGVSTNLILGAPADVDPKKYEAKPVSYQTNSGEGYSGIEQIVEAPKMPLTDVYGLHLSRQLKDQDFSVSEAKHLKQMLEDQLTDKVFERLTWYAPKDAADDNKDSNAEDDQEVIVDARWDEFTSRQQSNVELTQEIVFKDSIFKRYNRGGATITKEEIASRIKEILSKKAANQEDLKSTPVIMKQAGSWDPDHPLAREADQLRMLKDQRKYLQAYARDIQDVSQLLANILVSQDARYRYETYKQLVTNELFMEIGGIIMMYVNENTLRQDVAVKIVLGAQNRAPIIGYFPNKETYEQLKVFGAVIDYQNQLTDRSYNLSSFFNEAGNPISLKDLLLKSTDVNLIDTTSLPVVGDGK